MAIDRGYFFSTIRGPLFDGSLTQSQVDGLNAILDYWDAQPLSADLRWLAYPLATAHHETDRKFAPIAEYGRGQGKKYGIPNAQGQTYYGRGLVQLTWDYNYKTCSKYCGVDLVADPDLAMQMKYAIPIMFDGMRDGIFTGKALKDYFSPTANDWVGARRIINGQDRAQLIAGYGHNYFLAIRETAS